MKAITRFVLSGSALLAIIAGFATFAAADTASASSAVKLSSSRPDDQAAAAKEDASSLTTHELKCSSGYYVASVEAVETTWGLYPSIQQITLTCRNIDDKTDTERVSWPDDIVYIEGAGALDADYVREQSCASEGGFVTGMKVDYDSYIKDFQLRCGDQVITNGSGGNQSVKIDNHGYSGDWVFDRTESDDDQKNLVCNDSTRVMTGLRLRYKEDSDEIAITRLQLYCAVITMK